MLHYFIVGAASFLEATLQKENKKNLLPFSCKETNMVESVFRCKENWSLVGFSELTEAVKEDIMLTGKFILNLRGLPFLSTQSLHTAPRSALEFS